MEDNEDDMERLKKLKILKNIFVVLAIIISNVMIGNVFYIYAKMECAIEHKGFSAPADIAFLYAIPYALAIIICILTIYFINRKIKSIK